MRRTFAARFSHAYTQRVVANAHCDKLIQAIAKQRKRTGRLTGSCLVSMPLGHGAICCSKTITALVHWSERKGEIKRGTTHRRNTHVLRTQFVNVKNGSISPCAGFSFSELIKRKTAATNSSRQLLSRSSSLCASDCQFILCSRLPRSHDLSRKFRIALNSSVANVMQIEKLDRHCDLVVARRSRAGSVEAQVDSKQGKVFATGTFGHIK